jgi:ribosomal protein S18 acetylase RimI-like enzyme
VGLYDRSLIYSRQVQTAFRDGGTGYVACSITKKIFWPLCQLGYLVFFERDLKTYSYTVPDISPIRLALLTESECGLLAFSRSNDSGLVARAMERFRNGDQCFVALASGDEVAHSRWVSSSDTYIPELEMNTRPRSKQAYMYDGYSKPEFRGRGIDGAVRNFIFATLKSQGVENVYSYVRSDNPVGIRAAARWQSRMGRVWYLHFRRRRPLVFGLRQVRLPLIVCA